MQVLAIRLGQIKTGKHGFRMANVKTSKLFRKKFREPDLS